ncbi:MAG: amidohydrolase family protein [Candidatus Hodarchaeota archaeon]
MKGIIDFHLHPFLTYVSEDRLLSELDDAGIEYAVLIALDVDAKDLDRPEILERILQRFLDLHIWTSPQIIDGMRNLLEIARIDNKQVTYLMMKYPHKFLGFGSVNLSRDKSYIDEKIKEIHRLGLRGIKLIPTLQFFNPAKSKKGLKKIFRFCERKRKIVMCHSGCDPHVWEIPQFSEDANPKNIEYMIKEFKKVPVILAHMGSYSARYPGLWLDEAIRLGENYDNVWFDVAAVTYLVTKKRFVERIRKKVGFDHVLFGSDYPALGEVSIKSIVTEIRNSPFLTNKEKIQILINNARDLLDL